MSFLQVRQRLPMLFESPWIKVWVAMKFAPLLEPFTAFTTIIFILDSHAVFMGHTQLVWYTCLTLYVLVIIRAMVYQDRTLVRGW